MVLKVAFFDLGDTLVRDGEWVPGAEQTLSELQSLGLRLGIISNTGLPPTGLTLPQLEEHLPPDFDMSRFVERLILLSGDPEVAVQKPDRRIYQLALERAREVDSIEPGECLFCTESLHHALAAQSTGMIAARTLNPPGSDIASLRDELRKARLI